MLFKGKAQTCLHFGLVVKWHYFSVDSERYSSMFYFILFTYLVFFLFIYLSIHLSFYLLTYLLAYSFILSFHLWFQLSLQKQGAIGGENVAMHNLNNNNHRQRSKQVGYFKRVVKQRFQTFSPDWIAMAPLVSAAVEWGVWLMLVVCLRAMGTVWTQSQPLPCTCSRSNW